MFNNILSRMSLRVTNSLQVHHLIYKAKTRTLNGILPRESALGSYDSQQCNCRRQIGLFAYLGAHERIVIVRESYAHAFVVKHASVLTSMRAFHDSQLMHDQLSSIDNDSIYAFVLLLVTCSICVYKLPLRTCSCEFIA